MKILSIIFWSLTHLIHKKNGFRLVTFQYYLSPPLSGVHEIWTSANGVGKLVE